MHDSGLLKVIWFLARYPASKKKRKPCAARRDNRNAHASLNLNPRPLSLLYPASTCSDFGCHSTHRSDSPPAHVAACHMK